MKRFTTYAVVAIMLAVVLAPSLAHALVQPTNPIPGGPAVTTSTLETLINNIVQFLLTVSIIVAVGFLVWGGLWFIRGDPKKGKEILLNGVIGIAIILGVGLILSTVARFVNTGGQIN